MNVIYNILDYNCNFGKYATLLYIQLTDKEFVHSHIFPLPLTVLLRSDVVTIINVILWQI